MPSVLDELDLYVDNRSLPLNEIEEDMPLSPENQTWVNEQIAKAVADLKPHGFRRVVFWMKEWGAITALWTVPLALLGVVITLGIFTSNRISKEATFEQQTTDTLKGINDRLAQIDLRVSNSQLSELSRQPLTQESVKAIHQIVSDAQGQQVKLDESVVADAGKKLLDKADTIPAAWTTAQSLLGYRSTFNAIPASAQATYGPPETEPQRMFVRYDWPPGFSGEKFWQGYNKKTDIAELRRIGTPDPNDGKGGNALMILNGSTVVLDGMRMKHIVIENAVVKYSGGPISLDDVLFVNCRFDIQQKPAGQQLAYNILADQTIKFDA